MLKAVVNPRDVVIFVGFCFLYRRALKLVYQGQSRVLRLLRRGKDGPEIRPYEQSWLGFLEPRLRVFVRVLACLYVLNGALGGLANLGWRLIPGLREFISTVALTCYGGYFIDQLKRVSTRLTVQRLAGIVHCDCVQYCAIHVIPPLAVAFGQRSLLSHVIRRFDSCQSRCFSCCAHIRIATRSC
jgi:hypothetical protein